MAEGTTRGRTRRGPALLKTTGSVGIDIVDLRRIAASDARRPGALARRVLDDGEQRWLEAGGDRVERLAACLALKEGAIKALGGRPEGFAWRELARGDAVDAPQWITDALRELGAISIEPATVAGAPAAWGTAGEAVIAVVSTGREPASVATAAEPVATPPRRDLLTAAELAYCSRSAACIAGRAAAKTATARLLQLPCTPATAARVLIRPGVHPTSSPGPCRGSHPPEVLVDGEPGQVHVTLSHCPVAAVALAWLH